MTQIILGGIAFSVKLLYAVWIFEKLNLKIYTNGQ